MFKSEQELATWFIKTLKKLDLPSVKDALPGHTIRKEPFKSVLVRYFGSPAPLLLARPDVVLVVEDQQRAVDRWLLIAVELKHFRGVEWRRWRRAHREVGQPLRYYVFGFDSVALCHLFESSVDSAAARAYSSAVWEVVEKLKLPMAYFSAEASDESWSKLLVFRPLEVGGPMDWRQFVSWMIDYCRDHVRNPLLPHDREVVERRESLKTVLGVP